VHRNAPARLGLVSGYTVLLGRASAHTGHRAGVGSHHEMSDDRPYLREGCPPGTATGGCWRAAKRLNRGPPDAEPASVPAAVRSHQFADLLRRGDLPNVDHPRGDLPNVDLRPGIPSKRFGYPAAARTTCRPKVGPANSCPPAPSQSLAERTAAKR
jgi:hypothetical protein